jgi:hypothetical protein
VRLKSMSRFPIGQVMDEIRAEIEQKVPGLEIDLALQNLDWITLALVVGYAILAIFYRRTWKTRLARAGQWKQ